MVLPTNALQKSKKNHFFFSFFWTPVAEQVKGKRAHGEKEGEKRDNTKRVKKLFNTTLIVFFLLPAVRTASPATETAATAATATAWTSRGGSVWVMNSSNRSSNCQGRNKNGSYTVIART